MPERPQEAQQSGFQVQLERNRIYPDAHRRVRDAAEAFKCLTDPTPADYTDYWGERWDALGSLVGVEVRVGRCDRSRGEIQMLRAQGRTLVVRPPVITLAHLGRIHPRLSSWAVSPNADIESDSRVGYLDVETSVPAPHLGADEIDLSGIARRDGKYPMTLETYIIAAMDQYARTGQYLDDGYKTVSRLPGSRYRSSILYAGFDSHGGLHVDFGWPLAHREPAAGGRSEGVKRASTYPSW